MGKTPLEVEVALIYEDVEEGEQLFEQLKQSAQSNQLETYEDNAQAGAFFKGHSARNYEWTFCGQLPNVQAFLIEVAKIE